MVLFSQQTNKFKMSVASDYPVHSSSSDDLAAFLDGELDSCPNSSADSIPSDKAEDCSEVADHGSKRRKLEHLKTGDEDEEEIEEPSSSKDACEHPGSFGNMCFVCGQTLEETGVSFPYIHKSIRLNQDEISRRVIQI